MRIAVLGAAGWTGRAVLANLAGRHQVRASDWSPVADQMGAFDTPGGRGYLHLTSRKTER